MSSLNELRKTAAKYISFSKEDVLINNGNINYAAYFYGYTPNADQVVDENKIWTAFVKRFGQPVTIKTPDDWWNKFIDVKIVKKKALKKWFKQNQNRFLGSIKNAQEKYDEMMFNMDSHFDDYDGDSSNEQSDNKAPVDDIRDGRAMDQMESDFDLDRYVIIHSNLNQFMWDQ